jgi:hypothetical protein
MDGETIGGERDLRRLYRVISLLLALAGLAERMVGRPAALRCAILWLLRPVEAITEDYLAALSGYEAGDPDPMVRRFDDDGPEGALALAARFRAIAAALLTLAEAACAFVMPAVRAPRPAFAAPAAAGEDLRPGAAAWFDTS